MDREAEENLDRILAILEKRFSQEALFEHLLKQIEHHITELRELKLSGDPHLVAEVADLLLLSRAILKLENVPDRAIRERSGKFLDKVRGIYGMEQP